MSLAAYTGELMGTFPRLPYLHSIQLLNRAWSRYRDVRLWSFELVTDAHWFTPAIITTGTATATQFSTSITLNSTAATAVNAAGSTPPVASPVLGVGRQIRIGLSTGITPTNGNIYNIVSWNGTNTLTIDKPFGESSVSNSPYQIYKCYYAPPARPFTSTTTPDTSLIRFLTLTNRSNSSSIAGRRLNYTQQELNAFDPARGATDGYVRIIAPYMTNSLGQPTYELYPAPVAASVYEVTYWSRWPDISAVNDLPQVPYGLTACVMDLAKTFGAQWALSNVATFPELAQTNWVASQQMYKQDYLDGLKLCLKQDDEIMPQVPFFNGRKYGDFPLDGNFLQGHDVSGLLTQG